LIALAAKAEPPRASKAMAATTDFHIAIPVLAHRLCSNLQGILALCIEAYMRCYLNRN
jgi:hypothetical protein